MDIRIPNRLHTAPDSGNSHDGMVNKQFVASTTRNKMPPKRRLREG